MKTKLAIFIAVMLTATQHLLGSIDLTHDFELRENIWLKTSFDVYSDGHRVGTIDSCIFSLTAQFELKAKGGKILAKGSSRFFEWGMVMDVTDEHGEPLGRVEQDGFNPLPPLGHPLNFEALLPIYLLGDQYVIYGKDDRRVANARTGSWFTKMRIEDHVTGAKAAEIKRPWYSPIFFTKWKVKVQSPKLVCKDNIDPRLIIMTATIRAYKEKIWRAPFRSPELQTSQEKELRTAADSLIAKLQTFAPNEQEDISDEDFEQMLAILEDLQDDEIFDICGGSGAGEGEELTLQEAQLQICRVAKISFVQRLASGLQMMERSDINEEQKTALYHILQRYVDSSNPF